MSVQIEASDLILLVAQFLHEQGLQKTLSALEKETGVIYTPITQDLYKLIMSKSWDKVVTQIAHVPPEHLYDLYEYMIYDLREQGQFAVATTVLNESGVLLHMRDRKEERYLQLNSSSSRTTSLDKSLNDIADEIMRLDCISRGSVPQSRLLGLLNSGLKYEYEKGGITATNIDILRGLSKPKLGIFERVLSELSFGKKGAVECVVGNADGSYFVTGCRDGFMEVYNSNTGKLESLDYQLAKKMMSLKGGVLALDINDQMLLAGCLDGSVSFWNVGNGLKLKSVRLHSEGVSCVKFTSPTEIISSSFDGSIKLYGLSFSAQLKEFLGHSSFVNSIFQHGAHLYSTSSDNTVKMWDMKTAYCKITINLDASGIQLLPFNGFFMVCTRHCLISYSFECNETSSIEVKDEIAGIDKSLDEKYLYCALTKGTIRTFERVDGKWEHFRDQQEQLNSDKDEVLGIKTLENGSLVMFTNEGILKILI